MFFVFLFLVYFIHFFGSLVGSMRFFFRLIVLFGLLLFFGHININYNVVEIPATFRHRQNKIPVEKENQTKRKSGGDCFAEGALCVYYFTISLILCTFLIVHHKNFLFLLSKPLFQESTRWNWSSI